MNSNRFCAVIFVLGFMCSAWSSEGDPVNCNKSAAGIVEALQNQSTNNTTGKSTMAAALGDLQDLWGRYLKLSFTPEPKECADPDSTLDCQLFRRFKKSEIFETEASPQGRSSSFGWGEDLRQRLKLTAKALRRLRAAGGTAPEQRLQDLTDLQRELSIPEKSEFFADFKKAYLSDKSDGLEVIRAIRDNLRPPPDPEAPNDPVEEGICYEIHQSQKTLQSEAKQMDNSYLNPKSDVGQKMFGKNLKPFQSQVLQEMKGVVSAAGEITGRMQKACQSVRNEIFGCLLNKEKNLSRDPQVLKALENFELPIPKSASPGGPSPADRVSSPKGAG